MAMLWAFTDNVSPMNAFKNRYGLIESIWITSVPDVQKNQPPGSGSYAIRRLTLQVDDEWK